MKRLGDLALALLLGALAVALILTLLSAPALFATQRLVAALESQPPLDAASLRALPPGTPVAVEGVAAARNRLRWQTLVAYEFTRYHSTLYEVKESQSVVAPALWVDVAGGQVQIFESYALEDPPRSYTMLLMEKQGTDVYAGFEVGSRVSVIGVSVESADTGPAVRAQIVTGKSLAEFLHERRLSVAALPALDALLGVLALAAVGARVAGRR